MANSLISPGSLTREKDSTQITSPPAKVGAAVVGPTVKGKPNIPTLVTSYSEYVAKFGNKFTSGSGAGAVESTYLTSISAQNYFANGGNSLLVTRIVSRSTDFSAATSSIINSNEGLTTASLTLDITPFHNEAASVGSSSFSIEGITFTLTGSSGGTNTSTIIYFPSASSAAVSAQSSSAVFGVSSSIAPYSSSLQNISSSVSSTNITYHAINAGIGGNSFSLVSGSVTTSFSGGTNKNAFILETLSHGNILNSTGPTGSSGTLLSGSRDNFRWEIVNPNSSSGIFNLLIRRGDDKSNSPTILEEFRNLSLDPKASNYITKIIGDQVQEVRGSGVDVYLQPTGSYLNSSNYIRIKSVNQNTPDYFDNNGSARDIYTASIPMASSGTFGDATGDIYVGANTLYNNINSSTKTQGLTFDSYTTAINLLSNKDEFKYNIITTPGLIYQGGLQTPLNTLIDNTEDRGDAIIVLDLEAYSSTITNAIGTATNIDSSYVAAYWPWVQITEPDTGQLVWIPPSTLVPGTYMNNDIVGEPWFAAAGVKRGGLDRVRQAERKLNNTDRDILYVGKINSIATLPKRGVLLFGNKTLQTAKSSLDRVNVRRLLIELKNYITQVADNLVFEQNTTATRNTFLSTINPYLESVQQRQGLYAFRVVMDGSNNTNDVIDRNELIGAIHVQPTRTAEFIYLDFNILPTGATFPS